LRFRPVALSQTRPGLDGCVVIEPPLTSDAVHVKIGDIDCLVQYAGGASWLVAGVLHAQVPSTAHSGRSP
jgi:hypothetical protein